MFCPKCGKEIPDDSRFCGYCGQLMGPPASAAQVPPPPPVPVNYDPAAPPMYVPQPPPVQYGYPQPPSPSVPTAMPVGGVKNYLVESILVTLFCCLPLGIAGIVKSREVDKAVAMGNVPAAMQASHSAKLLFLWGLGAWAVLGGLWILAAVFGAAFN